MASSVSILNNYNGSLFSFGNKDLLMQGLMMKQGAYDANKIRLDQLRTQVAFLNIDESKQQDVEYLNNRIKATDDILRQAVTTGDLSNSYLMDQIVGKIEQVVDKPILNMVLSKRTRDNELRAWNEAMDKNDGSYNEGNFSVMSRNYQKYLNDGEVGTLYRGGGGFVKYVDLDKRFMDKEFNEYLKNSGINAEYVMNNNGAGEFRAIDTLYGTVDQDRLRQAIESYIGEDGRRQMAISDMIF